MTDPPPNPDDDPSESRNSGSSPDHSSSESATGDDPAPLLESETGLRPEPTQSLPRLDPLRGDAGDETPAGFGIPLDPPGRKGSLGRIGHYEVLNFVGRGGMGTVFRAFDDTLHRNVAIKVMSRALTENEHARMRFYREARSAASINHAHVVTIHAVAEHRKMPYLVMEYVEGKSLQERIRHSAPLETVDLFRIGAQIASGLAAAHKHGVIHRDIKPANILLEDGIERVRITDFGLARLSQENSDLTSAGALIGTPPYMSPEQVNGEELTPRSDLFSLGTVIYAMVLGHSPFRGKLSITSARRVVDEEPLPLSSLDASVPESLSRIVQKLMQKNPKDRFDSAEEAANLLTQEMVALKQATGRSPRRPDPGNRRRKLAIGSCALGAAVVGGVWLSGKPWYVPEQTTAAGLPTSAGARPSEDEPSPSPPEATRPPTTWEVTPEAGVSAITAALDRAGPGDTLHVHAGDYREAVAIDDPVRFRQLRIECEPGARLTASDRAPVLTVQDVPGVTIAGLTISTQDNQHGLEITGACPGLRVQDCRISPEFDSGIACLYLNQAASGSAAEPIVLERLQVGGGNVGIVVGDESPGRPPVRHVEIRNCRLFGNSRLYGIPLIIQNRVADIRVSRNILHTAAVGVSLSFPEPGMARDVELACNTLDDCTAGFSLNQSAAPQDVAVRLHLILAADTIGLPAPYDVRFDGWFEDNWWTAGPNCNRELVARIATLVPSLPVVSRTPDSPDFLRPTAAAPPETPGRHAADSTVLPAEAPSR